MGSGGRKTGRRIALGSVILWFVIAGPYAKSQSADSPKDAVGASLFSVPPRTWAADAAANELTALHHGDSYLRYRMETTNEKGNQVRDVVESKEGTVARLILKDGKPLTEEQDKWERQRLSDMVAAPAAYAKHVKNGESEKKTADTLVPLMADAMIYTYTPGQPQTGSNGGALEIVLDYKPNPNWVAPSTEAEALTGLEGRVWIDAKTHYLVRMLAHIYPGGKVVLAQTNAGGNRWIFTEFSMQLSVRALMLKTLNVRSSSKASGFQTLGAMSYQDAIHLMLSTPLPDR